MRIVECQSNWMSNQEYETSSHLPRLSQNKHELLRTLTIFVMLDL